MSWQEFEGANRGDVRKGKRAGAGEDTNFEKDTVFWREAPHGMGSVRKVGFRSECRRTKDMETCLKRVGSPRDLKMRAGRCRAIWAGMRVCVYGWVCVCVCMGVCVWICVYIYVYANLPVYVYVHV